MKRLMIMFGLCACGFAQQVAIAVNGESSAVIRPGQPLIVTATVTDRDGPVLRPEQLSAATASGEAVPLPFMLRSQTEPVKLGPMRMYSIVWTVAAEAIAEVPAGEYRVMLPNARLASFRITAEDDESSRPMTLLLLSAYAELEGDADRALELANKLIAEQPRSVAGRLRRSDLLLARGDTAGALEAAMDADRLQREDSGRKPEHPGLIQARIAQILDVGEEK